MFWTRPIHIFLLELLSDEFYIEFKINTLFKPTVLVLLCVVMTTNDPHSLSVLGHSVVVSVTAGSMVLYVPQTRNGMG